jgi:hypothetical protein
MTFLQVPEAWANVKKKALVTKEKHSKEQNAQVRTPSPSWSISSTHAFIF